MAASSIKQPSLLFSVLVLVVFLVSHPVYSDDEEDHLLQGLNSFRTSANLSEFAKNKNANCVAKKIAGDMDDDGNQLCTNPSNSRDSNGTRLTDYPKAISKCNIDTNTASGVVVLPVCVPHLVPTLVLTNFTRTHYSRFINDSSFTGIGLGSEDDWMVVVLASNTPPGSLANGAYSYGKLGLSYYIVFLLLGFVNRLNLA
ncbi:NAD(P)-binding Rossmann-fold superfamily protein [Hibiscus syriacus]|uniref:NAD(P)-binding Rossmann-fold superfamily protein n=1 Tax=Hibiscus syriacus TaxID=106335 RepID=A0A6A3ATL5_HIBSY|nr:uncharacterized GPI-anchored protein At5g19250-like [Hibiscus syriacus]KAE8706445.1 NAD(P)-binding Rossmann-fold superfamily protein [Hibiscus syriacus]